MHRRFCVRVCACVTDNAYAEGGGISASGPAVIKLTDCDIYGNVGHGGGGIALLGGHSGSLTLIRCNIFENRAWAAYPDPNRLKGGGILAMTEGVVILTKTIVRNNSASALGSSHNIHVRGRPRLLH